MPLCAGNTPGRSRSRKAAWVAASSLLPLTLLLTSCSTEPPSPDAGAGSTPAASSGAGSSTPGTSGSASTAAAKFESPRKAEGDVFIAVITNGISPFWDPMGVGMKKAAAELGCKAEWSGPQNSTVAEQKRMVEDALAKGADGIALSCIEPEASVAIVQMVLDKNVPIITFDSDSPTSGRLCYIGTNNFNAGKAAGKAATELVPAGSKFVGFVGNISASNARERRDGFVESAKEKNIEVIDVLDDNKDASRARSNVENAIAKHNDQVQGFLGLFSYNGPAIVQAVSNAKLRDKYKIVAFDAEPVTLQELEKGNIDATVVQKPYDFGYLSTKLLYLINRKGWSEAKKEMNIPEDGMYDTGVEVITPGNVRDYKKGLEALGIKSS